MKRGLVVIVLIAGILIGLALAKWLVSAVAAIGTALVIVAVVLVAYLVIKRRMRARRERPQLPA
jgi:membrane protein implicated in regulation of membrane protease activity